jgi:hypothetical protein
MKKKEAWEKQAKLENTLTTSLSSGKSNIGKGETKNTEEMALDVLVLDLITD